jgi:type II secretory pathway component PulM
VIALLERLRETWEALNDRERLLVGGLGAVMAVFLLGFPLFWTARQNAEIEERNAELRSVLELIAARRPQLQQLQQARAESQQRYKNRTPPLGSFVESEAKRHNLTIREVTDQPQKTSGNYTRRSVTASINDVDLTGIMNLLSGIVGTQYPVAIDHVQIEHYQPGDKYRFKLGVRTFDRKATAAKDSEAPAQTEGG